MYIFNLEENVRKSGTIKKIYLQNLKKYELNFVISFSFEKNRNSKYDIKITMQEL